jgi:hypothetical protein
MSIFHCICVVLFLGDPLGLCHSLVLLSCDRDCSLNCMVETDWYDEFMILDPY